jgi:hypothetical protein
MLQDNTFLKFIALGIDRTANQILIEIHYYTETNRQSMLLCDLLCGVSVEALLNNRKI